MFICLQEGKPFTVLGLKARDSCRGCLFVYCYVNGELREEGEKKQKKKEKELLPLLAKGLSGKHMVANLEDLFLKMFYEQ